MRDLGKASYGAGKYNQQLKEALEKAGAEQGVLIVIDGNEGPSFCAQLDFKNTRIMPDVLKKIADQIERHYKKR